MDPTRISKEHAHCVRTLFGHQENTDLHDTSFESQEVKLMPESCRSMKQALQRAVQKVGGRQTMCSHILLLLLNLTVFPTPVFRGKFCKVFSDVRIMPEVASKIVLCLLMNLVVVNQFCIPTHSTFAILAES